MRRVLWTGQGTSPEEGLDDPGRRPGPGIPPSRRPRQPGADIQAFGDDSLDVRRKAADAVGHVGRAAVPDLLRALADPDEQRRTWAAAALVTTELEIAPDTVRTIVALLSKALKHSDPAMRSVASWQLLTMGPKAETAVGALIEALGDAEADVRRNAAQALGRIGRADEAVIAALTNAAKDENAEVRKEAADALRKLRSPTQP